MSRSWIGILALSLVANVAHAGDPPGFGTLGYGSPGLHPGFQGFSLKYRLGYGYGGRALGVGAFGGYPRYGGPGYPSPDPRTVFQPVTKPMEPTRDVAQIVDSKRPGTPLNFGPYSGAIPYPESYFAPYVSSIGIPDRYQQPAPLPVRQPPTNLP